jgi:RimJ/RimL family protein N-acetyltransferase
LQNIEDLIINYAIGCVHSIAHLRRTSSEPHQIIKMNKYEPYFIKTNRLGFRKWREDDLGIAMELWGDYEVTKFFDMRGKLSQKEVQERLAREIKCQKRQIYEIGFHIRSNQWRRGYAREAAHAVTDYAFSTLKAKALFAGHNPQNAASDYLLKQLGFRYTHDEYYPPTGLNHPSYLLKANEYRGIR